MSKNKNSKISKSAALWKKAKKIIPGGTMLYSKRPDLYLPDSWPVYFTKTKDCYVWSLDKKRYIDFSTMSVGTNTLGYSNLKVDKYVLGNIKKGNMSSLNCPEEVHLAEKLLEIHPGFESIKFARTGGEANAIAIRISRAASAKDKYSV